VSQEIPLARASFEHWERLIDLLGHGTEFVRSGNLLVASEATHVAALVEKFDRQRGLGVPSRLVGGVEAREICPWFRDDIVLGLYNPDDAQFSPPATIRLYADHVASVGVDIHSGQSITQVLKKGGRWELRGNGGLELLADRVIVAAGPGINGVLASLGIQLPILNCRVVTLLTEEAPSVMSTFVQDWDHQLFLRQTSGGAIQAGHLGQDFLRVGHDVSPTEHEMILTALEASMPNLDIPSVVRSWGGLIDESRDRMPIIGGFDGLEGVVVAGGWSGHGYLLAPYVGMALAREVLCGEIDPLLAPFAPERFSITGDTSNVDA